MIFIKCHSPCSILFWQLIRNRYPSKEILLFDDVLGIYAFLHVSFTYVWLNIYVVTTFIFILCEITLYFTFHPATFVLHHPEHGHAVVLPIISCIIDGTLVYDKASPPFASFISSVCPKIEV